MSFCGKDPTAGAILEETMSMDTSTLAEENLSDFQTLAELSEELTLNSQVETEVENTIENEVEDEMVMEPEEMIEHEEEVLTEEVVSEEMEVDVPEEEELVTAEVKSKPNVVPPLRPLTIAPKPTKIPLTVKPMTGQQFLLLQGGNTGQTIKLLSPQGQELNVANLLSRPMTVKPTFKTVQSQSGNISIIQQKPLVVKKIISSTPKIINKPVTISKTGQTFVVVQKSSMTGNNDQSKPAAATSQPQQIKLIQSPTNVVTGTTKTITLQQAQEMGLLTNTKIISQSQNIPKQQTLLLKNATKTVRLVPQQQVTSTLVSGGAATPVTTKTISLAALKSPTKILPASTMNLTKNPQRIILKTSGGGGGNATIIPQGQIIQVTGTQGLGGGQLHQINIPGKGMQYIKFVSASAPETTTTVTPTTVKTAPVTTSSSILLSEVKPITVSKQLAPKPITSIPRIQSQMVVIPSLSASLQASKVPIPASPTTLKTVPKLQKTTPDSYPMVIPPPDETDANGMRPRKPCNCTKSQCLKLYCDCFANGEFCYMCKCMNCFNNLENEVHRTRAIKACLERNPHAFKPKIGKDRDIPGDVNIRKHTKGCNCKRSGCLKNYCECYEAKISCSSNCKCIGCCNMEDQNDNTNNKKRPISSVEKATNTINHLTIGQLVQGNSMLHPRRTSNSRKQTINFITDDVIEATCECLLTISDNADDKDIHDEELIKRLIIEEFGRCLTEIIDCSSRRSLVG